MFKNQIRSLLTPARTSFTPWWGAAGVGRKFVPEDFVNRVILDAENARRHLITANGDAQLDGSGACVLDGTGDNLSTIDSDDWDFDTGDLTIGLWVNFDNVIDSQALVSHGGDLSSGGEAGWILFKGGGNWLYFRIWETSAGAVLDLYSAWAPTINTWHYICVTRTSGIIDLSADGVSLNTAPFATTLSFGNENLKIGSRRDGSFSLDGAVSRVEICKGLSRYTTPFTPPVRLNPITIDVNNVLAPNFEGDVGSTRILDSAKPSYVLAASDDFSNGLSRRRFDTLTVFGNGSVNVVGERLEMSASSGGEIFLSDTKYPDITEDFSVIVDWDYDNPTNQEQIIQRLMILGPASTYIARRRNLGVESVEYRLGGLPSVNIPTAATSGKFRIRGVVGTGTLSVSYDVGEGWVTASISAGWTLTGILLNFYNAGATLVTSSFDNLLVTASGIPLRYSVDAGSTPIVPDTSGQEIDVTNATPATQPVFDPSDDSLDYIGSKILRSDKVIDYEGKDFSIDVAIRTTNNGNGTPFTIDSSNSHGAAEYAIDIYTVAGAIQGNFSDGTNQRLLTFIGTYADGDPHLISLVRIGSTFYMYFDGVLSDSGSVSGDMNPGQTPSVGSRHTGAEYFEGDILGVRGLLIEDNPGFNLGKYQEALMTKYGV